MALFFAVNTIFITESTLRDRYDLKGNLGLFYEPSKIISTTLISIILTKIFKAISFTENIILNIKDKRIKKNNKKLIHEIYIDIAIISSFFCVVGLLFLFLFWFYIASFYAIHPKIQFFGILRSLISFGIFLILPLILSVFPTISRIMSLQIEKELRPYLYSFSQLLQLI